MRNEKQGYSCDILYKIPEAWKRKDDVNITQLWRSSSFELLEPPLFYFRIAVLSQSRNTVRKVIVRNHFYAFATLTLMMKCLSTLLGTPSFHSSVDDHNQLPVVYPTSHWIRVILLMFVQPDFDIVLYFFPYYSRDNCRFIIDILAIISNFEYKFDL